MATLPVAIKCLKEKMGYDKNLVSFIVPVCIATNKDGTAINLAFTAIFFAQYTNTDLSVSAASPGVPQRVLLILIVMLKALDISPEYAGTIIAVDIIVDRIGR